MLGTPTPLWPLPYFVLFSRMLQKARVFCHQLLQFSTIFLHFYPFYHGATIFCLVVNTLVLGAKLVSWCSFFFSNQLFPLLPSTSSYYVVFVGESQYLLLQSSMAILTLADLLLLASLSIIFEHLFSLCFASSSLRIH